MDSRRGDASRHGSFISHEAPVLHTYPNPDISSSIQNQVHAAATPAGYSTLILTGSVLKWTNYLSQWQWRYLVVQNGRMIYFKSKNEAHLGCRGELSLSYAKINPSFYDPTRFDVVMPHAEAQWYFKADNEINRDKWVGVLKSNIEFAMRFGVKDGVPRWGNKFGLNGDSGSMYSHTESIDGRDGSDLGLDDENNSLVSLRKSILDINAYKKALYDKIQTLEEQFDRLDEQDNLRGDILTLKTTVDNIQRAVSEATDILSTHEDSWRHKLTRLSKQVIALQSNIKKSEVLKTPTRRGHRRANTANSPIEIHNNSPQKSTTIAQSKPSSLIFNQTGNTQQIPHHILDSPLSEDEFFDAIDELTASFDQAEENKEHNKEISKKLLLQNPEKIIRNHQKSPVNHKNRENQENQENHVNTENTENPENQVNPQNNSELAASETMTEHKIHRYSDKVSAHIEKHAKSLNNNPEDDEKDGWKEFHSEGKMRMFRRDEATPDGRIIDPLRLFHTIDKVSAYECQHYFWDTKYRLEWEHTIEKFKILEVLDGTTIVLLQDHKRVWPAAKRDAVYLSSMQCLSDFKSDDPCYLDTWIVTNFSVEHDLALYKPSDNNVRVFIDVCMMCQTYKKDASKSENDRENIFTKVTYISQVDPGGWLPPAALRKVYKKEYPRFLRNFSKYVGDKTKGDKNVLYEHKYE